MVRQHEQHRESELVVLVDLFATREFTDELVEKTISLAATLCVEQTRHATSGTFRMAVAGRELQSLEVTGAGRFRDAALKALAVSEPSTKAGLASMLMSVCNGPITAASRFVLMTPRPEAARLLTEAIARDALRNEVLLTSRLLVLKADHATLDDVFLAANSDALLDMASNSAARDLEHEVAHASA
jgi:hypothetical protein